jgi:transposase
MRFRFLRLVIRVEAKLMAQATLLRDPTQVELMSLKGTGTEIIAVPRARADSTRCPLCSARSERVHSRYTRRQADLPWCGVAVRLQFQVRDFFCDQPMCPRAIFTVLWREGPCLLGMGMERFCAGRTGVLV